MARRWKHTLNLKDVFHNEDISFEEKRDGIVQRIRAAPWFDEYDFDLEEIIENLSESDTLSVFDDWWDCFYDWADANRVWVETF